MSRFTGLAALGIAGLAATACGPEEGIANNGRHLQSVSADAGMNFGADTFVADSAVFERTNTINQAVAGASFYIEGIDTEITDITCDAVIPAGIENGTGRSHSGIDTDNDYISIGSVVPTDPSRPYAPLGMIDIPVIENTNSFDGFIDGGETDFYLQSPVSYFWVNPSFTENREEGLYTSVTTPFIDAVAIPNIEELRRYISFTFGKTGPDTGTVFVSSFDDDYEYVMKAWEVNLVTLEVFPPETITRNTPEAPFFAAYRDLYGMTTITLEGENGPATFVISRGEYFEIIANEYLGRGNPTRYISETDFYAWLDSTCMTQTILNEDGSVNTFNGAYPDGISISDLYYEQPTFFFTGNPGEIKVVIPGHGNFLILIQNSSYVALTSGDDGDTGVDGGYPDATADAGGYTPDTSDGFSGSDSDAGGDSGPDATTADAGAYSDVEDVDFADAEVIDLDTDIEDDTETDTPEEDTVEDVDFTDAEDIELDDTDIEEDAEPELDTDTPEEDVDAGTPDSGPERPVDVPNNYTPDAGTNTPPTTPEGGVNQDQGGGCSAVQEETSSRADLALVGLLGVVATGLSRRRKEDEDADEPEEDTSNNIAA